jgi:type II pantothenate kinase
MVSRVLSCHHILPLLTESTHFYLTSFTHLEMLDLSQNGDNRNVDLLVGDIYGSDYSKLGLKSTRIASSFGKVFKKGVRQSQDAFNPEDISKSLLYMVSCVSALPVLP